VPRGTVRALSQGDGILPGASQCDDDRVVLTDDTSRTLYKYGFGIIYVCKVVTLFSLSYGTVQTRISSGQWGRIVY
jgi:hypothetical protein